MSPQDSFEIFPWNENLETGIEIIDEQHKKLIELLNQLTDTLVKGDAVELTRVFDDLAAYAKYHFETEEAIWAPCFGDDPWLVSHQDTHSSFLPKVIELKEEQGDKPLVEIVEHVVKFLIRWLTFHIIKNDKRMAIVMRKVEAGFSLEDAKEISDEEMSGSARVLIDTVLNMYDALSSRTIALMRERIKREKAEEQLRESNLKLADLAKTDQLTELFNRRHLDDIFERELRRATREKRFLSFIMFDLDYFKKLNDRYGHFHGDLALKRVGQELKENCRRPGDYVFRLGGEEFGVLIADQLSQNVREFAERIRTAIEGLSIPNLDSEVADHLTVSVGAVIKVPTSKDTVDTYMKDADTTLYRAKKLGRNRVAVLD